MAALRGRLDPDVTGMRFSRWLVMERGPYAAKGEPRWWCRCECGTVVLVLVRNLRNGLSPNCRPCGLRAAHARRDKSSYKGRPQEDLTGQCFGSWTVLEPRRPRNSLPQWLCRCACGKQSTISTSNLRKGVSQRCRSCALRARHEQARGPDLTGQRFGTRIVLERRKKYTCNDYWLTRCECGAQDLVAGWSLRNGKRRACLRCNNRVGHAKTHGQSRKPEYRAWGSMIARCTNPRVNNFGDYGGRGITVCPRWRASYEDFLADVGSRPGPEYSLDRIDVNGHYEPHNVRWATRGVQNRNRRNTLVVSADRLEHLATRIRQGEQIILADLQRVVIAPFRRESGRRDADPREPGEEQRQEPKNDH
jgi:hypothetical protein